MEKREECGLSTTVVNRNVLKVENFVETYLLFIPWHFL